MCGILRPKSPETLDRQRCNPCGPCLANKVQKVAQANARQNPHGAHAGATNLANP
jgi:hypothetical protein